MSTQTPTQLIIFLKLVVRDSDQDLYLSKNLKMAANTLFYISLQVALHNYFKVEIHLKFCTKLETIFASCALLAGW
jgi:hypothetical protein